CAASSPLTPADERLFWPSLALPAESSPNHIAHSFAKPQVNFAAVVFLRAETAIDARPAAAKYRPRIPAATRLPDQQASCGDGPTVRHLEIAAESNPEIDPRDDDPDAKNTLCEPDIRYG
ncbi:MAG TPA: hypothetical protein VM487_12215, partial [Phycisphaerae bacterium]|nr:hypothetical protein [Phycisphaerae bacterium]